MSAIAICNGRLIDPAAGMDAPKDILLENGRVAEIAGPGKLKNAEGANVLDAKGMVVAPGLIDIHVHLREPGQAYKEPSQPERQQLRRADSQALPPCRTPRP